MKILKIILILLFPIVVDLIIGCCDCLEPIFFNYTHCSLNVENLDNTGPNPVSSNSSTIKKEAFGLRLHISRKEDFCQIRTKSLFISSAYATSCDCPPEEQYLPLDSIISIKITTVNDFDPENLTGSDISGYFFVFQSMEFSLITEYLNHLEATLYELNSPTLIIDLLLMTTPSLGKEHQFEIGIELSDGRILFKQSDIVELI